MALKDIILKLVIDGKESLVTLDKLDNKTLGIGKTVKNLAGAMGLAFGSAQVIGFMKDSVALVQRENEVIGKLNATLKSTNYSAGLMSDELVDLAKNLEELSNYKFDDKDIIDAEGLMLTFKSINKEVFPEAIRLAMDLSVRFDQDLKTSVIQLGKALDDPIRGITALRKSGVMFTDAQEEQIKALVKTNDLLGAQKIILAELSTQVEGSAAASVDAYTLKVNQLNEALEDVQNTLGQIVTLSATGMLDFLGALVDNGGNIQAAMMSFQMQQRNSKWKPSTQADFLNEARNRAKGEIGGKSDAQIKGLIGNNRAMYNASFMGLDMLGNPIDPEGNLAMLNAKLGVYQSALIKTDDKINDNKKENATDYYKHLEQLEDDLWKARGDVLSDESIPMLGDYKSMSATGPEGGGMASRATLMAPFDKMLKETDIFANSMTITFDRIWSKLIEGGLEAADIMNALFSSILSQIGQILSNEIFSSLTTKGASKAGSGGSGFIDTLFSLIPFLGEGGIVTKPTLAAIGESGPEAVIPLDRLSRANTETQIRVIVEGEIQGDSIYLANKRATKRRNNNQM